MPRYDHSSSDVATIDFDAVARGRSRRRPPSEEHQAIERELGGDAPSLATLATRSAIVGAVAGAPGGPVWSVLGAGVGVALAYAFAER